MLDIAQQHLEAHLSKIGVQVTAESWMKQQHLSFRAANGEEVFESAHRFDRIIANLVLMATQDPLKMMSSLHQMAGEGCLLGVTVWGDQQHSNLLTIMAEAMAANNMPIPNERPHSHLFNKLQQLGDDSGWELLLQWEQNAPFHFISLSQEFKDVIAYWCRGKQPLIDFYFGRVQEILKTKKSLNFPAQCAIFRKK
jgi:hypothetical protein